MPRQSVRKSKNNYKIPNTETYTILCGRSNPKLANDIAGYLGQDVFDPISIFSDGEIRVRVPVNMRRKHVFIIQPTASPVNDHLMELVFMIDAARRSSASEITAIIPYYGYARQDRKEMPRVPISASVVAQIIQKAGADRIVTIDLHSEQQQGFTKIPWDNLYASYSLIPVLKKRKFKNMVVASPDKGGMTRAIGYSKLLGAEGVALVYKERDISTNNTSGAMDMIGKVEGKDVILVDDMIDTGGTLVHAASLIKKRGARKILAAAAHGLFSGNALEKIENSDIDEVLITDTILQPEKVVKNKKITIISVAPLLAEAIRRIETGESISKDLIL